MKKTKERVKPKQKDEQQLDLGIKEPFKNKFLKIKYSFTLSLLKFEVRKFFKDPLLWATLTVGIVLIGHQIYLILQNFSDLPVYLPVFRYFISIPRKLVVKDYIIIFPIISGVCLILSLILTSRYYNTEKALTKFLLFSSLLCILSQSIILIDLIKIF